MRIHSLHFRTANLGWNSGDPKHWPFCHANCGMWAGNVNFRSRRFADSWCQNRAGEIQAEAVLPVTKKLPDQKSTALNMPDQPGRRDLE